MLAALHASVPSLVLFRLAALRPFLDDESLRRMLRLDGVDLAAVSHAALTPFGSLVAGEDGRVWHPRFGAPPPVSRQESLLGAYGPWLEALPASEPDCLGVGRRGGELAVALHVRVEGRDATGVAAFADEPSLRDYDLLRTVGVEYLGGERRGRWYLARFANRLDEHLSAARLARFARTDHCNLFFIGGGELDERLAGGLRDAATARIADGLAHVRSALTAFALQAEPPALLSVPAPPAQPAPYGNVVPFGIALAALRDAPGAVTAQDAVARRLLAEQREGLWPFHAGGLPTATDTALVQLGFEDPELAPLEAFGTPGGGYVPQLWGVRRTATRMQAEPATRHWCQPDVATTALVVAHRHRAGLPAGAAEDWLAQRFDRRSGLFFANPYLVDWALARALGEQRGDLRHRLRDEIAASVRPDHAFGGYDEGLSTALAILALASLGERGRIVRLAQLRLLDFLEPDGRLAPAVPFYSSVLAGPSTRPATPQVRQVGDHMHAITYYVDVARIMTTAFAALALAVPADDGPAEAGSAPPHPRYVCRDVESYVTGFALAPFVEHDGAHAELAAERGDALLA
jgi:hypothetical protein